MRQTRKCWLCGKKQIRVYDPNRGDIWRCACGQWQSYADSVRRLLKEMHEDRFRQEWEAAQG